MKFNASDLGIELVVRSHGDVSYLQASRTAIVEREGARHAHVLHVRRPLAEVERSSGHALYYVDTDHLAEGGEISEIDPDALHALLGMLTAEELANFAAPGGSHDPEILAGAKLYLSPTGGALPDPSAARASHVAGDVDRLRATNIAHSLSGHGFADSVPSDTPIEEPPMPTIAEIEAAGYSKEAAQGIFDRQLAIVGAWRAGARTHAALRDAMDEIDAAAGRTGWQGDPPQDEGDDGDRRADVDDGASHVDHADHFARRVDRLVVDPKKKKKKKGR